MKGFEQHGLITIDVWEIVAIETLESTAILHLKNTAPITTTIENGNALRNRVLGPEPPEPPPPPE